MSINIKALQSFNKAANINNLDENARLGKDKFNLDGGHRISKIPGNKYDRSANFEIRRDFARALTGSFGVDSLEQLPDEVRKALKIEDFKLDKDGQVTSSRPLTARRVRAVMTAVQEVTAKAAPSASEAADIRSDFNNYLQNSGYMKAAFDRIAIAEGRKCLTLQLAPVSAERFELPISALEVYTKGIAKSDLPGKLEAVKASIESDVALALDTLAKMKYGETLAPDRARALALTRYFALCAVVSNQTENPVSRTVSVPDQDGKIADYLSRSLIGADAKAAKVAHMGANPFLPKSVGMTRFTIDIGFDAKKSAIAEPSYPVFTKYAALAAQDGYSPLLRRDEGPQMSVAQMHANISAERMRLTNAYSAEMDVVYENNPRLKNFAECPEPHKTNLDKIETLRRGLDKFWDEIEGMRPGTTLNRSARYADETVLTEAEIPAFGRMLGVFNAQAVHAAAPVRNEEDLYKNLTLDSVIDELARALPDYQVKDKSQAPEMKRKAAIAALMRALPPDKMTQQEIQANLWNMFMQYKGEDSNGIIKVDKILERIDALPKRELYILRLCALATAGYRFTDVKELRTFDSLYNDLMVGKIPLDVSGDLLKVAVVAVNIEKSRTTEKKNNKSGDLTGPGIVVTLSESKKKIWFPNGIFIRGREDAQVPVVGGVQIKNPDRFFFNGYDFVENRLVMDDATANRRALQDDLIPQVFLSREWGFNTSDFTEILKLVRVCGYDPTTISHDDVHKLMTLARLRNYKLDDIPGFYARVLHKDIKDIDENDMKQLLKLSQSGKLLDPLDILDPAGPIAAAAGLFTGGKLPSDAGISGEGMLRLIGTLREFARDGGEMNAVVQFDGRTVKLEQNASGLLFATIDGLKIAALQSAAGLVSVFEEDMVSNISRFGEDVILKMLPELSAGDIADLPGSGTHLRELCLRIVADRLDAPANVFATVPTKMLRTIAMNALLGYYSSQTGGVNKDAASAVIAQYTRNDVFTGEEICDLRSAMNRMGEEALNRKVIMPARPTQAKPKAGLAGFGALLGGLLGGAPAKPDAAKLKEARLLVANLFLSADIVTSDDAVRGKRGGERMIALIERNLDLFVDIILDPENMLGGVAPQLKDAFVENFKALMEGLPQPQTSAERLMMKPMCKQAIQLVLEAAAHPENERLGAIVNGINEKNALKGAVTGNFVDAGDLAGAINTVAGRLGTLDAEFDRLVLGAMGEIQGLINEKISGAEPPVNGEMNAPADDDSPIWQKSFDSLVSGALSDPKSGYGKFMHNVLTRYFAEASPKEARQMIASLLRNADENSTPGQVLGALFKGAGPLFQKMLQALPTDAFGPEMRDALKDMKSNLQPIPDEIVQAHLLDIVERSNGAITSVKVNRSLGAATVGQAFLCTIYTKDHPEGEECVVKILRPNIKTVIENEKRIFMEAAKDVPGMEKTFEAQYARILDELDFTKEKTNINYARKVYEKPIMISNEGLVKTTQTSVTMDKLHSLEVHPLVPPTMDALILKKAPGETYDRFMDNTRQKADEILAAARKGDDGVYRFDNPAEMRLAKDQLVNLYNDAKKRHDYLLDLTKKWVQEALYGNGFYHGDLHAGNIMSDGEGLTVIDFGNATHLTLEERSHVLRMMASAMFGREKFFETSFLALISPEYRDAYARKNVNNELSNQLHEILNKGTTMNAGERIFAALMFLQSKEIEIPGPIFNFAQCQMRLGGTVDEMERLMSSLKADIKKLDLQPIEAEVPDLSATGHAAQVRGILSAIHGFLNMDISLDTKREMLDTAFGGNLKKLDGDKFTEEENRITEVKRNFSEAVKDPETFDRYIRPFAERLVNSRNYFYANGRGSIAEGCSTILKSAMDMFLKYRETGNQQKIDECVEKFVDNFFSAALMYVHALTEKGPKLAPAPDDGEFVYAIADVINSNLQPAMKLLGEMKWKLVGDKIAADKAATQQEKRMAESPARIQAYLDTYAVAGVDANGERSYKVSPAMINAIKRISENFQMPADLPGRDGGTKAFKIAANRAVFLSTMQFNLDLLEKELRDEGLIPENIDQSLRRHIARIATQFFADRIGGIDDAVRKLPNKVYGKLIIEATNLNDPSKLFFTVDVLDHLRNPLRLPAT